MFLPFDCTFNYLTEVTNRGTQSFLRHLLHLIRKDLFKSSTLGWRTDINFNKAHTEKCIGFKSGDAGGHISLLQNLGKLRLHQSWVFPEEWHGAPSCWKVKHWSLEVFFISFSKSGVKISLLNFIYAPRKPEVTSKIWRLQSTPWGKNRICQR